MSNRILIFGDSITYGAWDEKGGWADRLKQYYIQQSMIDPKSYNRIFNLGVMSYTSKDVLERMENETKPRLSEDGETVFIFAIGTNDAGYVHSKKEHWVTPKKYEKNLQEIINKSEQYTSKILFLEITPVNEELVNPMPWNMDLSYKNKWIRQYNNILKKVCKKNEIHFIETFEEWIKQDYKKWLYDGAHLNTQGHEKIFETVKEYLTKNSIV